MAEGHFLEGKKGHYRGIDYTWRYANGKGMGIVFDYRDEKKRIYTGHEYNMPEREKIYGLCAEMMIDEFLEKVSFEEVCEKYLRKGAGDE